MSASISLRNQTERSNLHKNIVRSVVFICASFALNYFLLERFQLSFSPSETAKLNEVPLNIRLYNTETSPFQEVKLNSPKAKSSVQTSKPATGRQAARETPAQSEGISETQANEQEQINTPPSNIAEVEVKADSDKKEVISMRLPPAAEMKMEVSYLKPNASPTNGIGELAWQYTPRTYSASLSVSIDLLLTTVRLIQINSEGKITSSGLAPTMSTDTRRARPSTAIHFDQNEKNIIFSSSNKSVPMEDGAQDAVSVLFQLAIIGNSNPQQLAVGKEINIQVAEGRDAQTYTFQVIAEEEIESPLTAPSERLHTIHLIRPPRPGSYNSTLEIWLAPEKSWFPVQIKNTESNGTVTTQRVIGIRTRERLPE